MDAQEAAVTQPKETLEAAPDVMELLLKLNTKMDALLAEKQMANSPWVRGDQGAAEFAGYRSRRAFREWAKKHRIKPMVEDGMNFWDRAAIAKARSKQQTY